MPPIKLALCYLSQLNWWHRTQIQSATTIHLLATTNSTPVVQSLPLLSLPLFQYSYQLYQYCYHYPTSIFYHQTCTVGFVEHLSPYFGLFPILRINKMASFCNLFIE